MMSSLALNLNSIPLKSLILINDVLYDDNFKFNAISYNNVIYVY